MSKSYLSALVISLILLGCGPDLSNVSERDRHRVVDAGTSEFFDTGANSAPQSRDAGPQNDQHQRDDRDNTPAPDRDDHHRNDQDREDQDNDRGRHNPAPENDCKGLEDAIYVIDRDSEAIYYYDTREAEFNHVGDLDCGQFAGQPASMSIARDGFAYVRYYDDTLYSVNLDTMECEETSYESDFGHFGMGFATINANGWRDELYVANRSQLARLDVANWTMENVGRLPSQSELTGNRLGQLWAILPLETPARVVELNKENARIERSINLERFPNPYTIDTFAFANWGGDFFIFVRQNGMGESTRVLRVSGSDGSTQVDAEDTGLNIVGAGVSTCATAAR